VTLIAIIQDYKAEQIVECSFEIQYIFAMRWCALINL